MKKVVFYLSFVILLMTGNILSAQDQPKPQKDTVNIDTDAKPTFYYAEEDEVAESKGNTLTFAIVAGVAVVLAAGLYVAFKRKK